MSNQLQTIWAGIPVYNPDRQLVAITEELSQSGLGGIIITDDGSASHCADAFTKIASLPGVTLLRHDKNRGKGAALKTIFCHYLHSCTNPDGGIVTMDGDGQHLVEDAVRIARSLQKHREALILGVRSFSTSTPRRSCLGNAISKFCLSKLFGLELQDTQTGLRGLPQGLVKRVQSLPYNRYEFEAACLLTAYYHNYPIRQKPIATIYQEGNPTSHFRPIADSFRIAAFLLKEKFKPAGLRS